MRSVIIALLGISTLAVVSNISKSRDMGLEEMVRMLWNELSARQEEVDGSNVLPTSTPTTQKPKFCVRPTRKLSWFQRVPIPCRIGGRCKARGRFAVREHCSKYLTCSSLYFGFMRTCTQGKMYDSVQRKCLPASNVDCCKL